ncbi:cell division protein SepF [Furfurilactobacillus curtus]|uniref:Cell division protein SepF n=1 Tax=Furfurilactobacillus curtus TaxID=1746200 RepID=A0ABQ5JM68_9LACO
MAFSFSNFFGMEETDATVNNSTASQSPRPTSTGGTRRPAKVVDMAGRSAIANHISLFEPRIYSDVKEIAQQLLESQAVIVNFDKLDDQSSRRMVDFLTGAVFAISGEIKRVGDTIFLCTPNSFEVSGDLTAQFDQNGHNF